MCDPVSTHWVVQSYSHYVTFRPQKVSGNINEQYKLRYMYVGSCMVFMLCTVMGLCWLTSLYICTYEVCVVPDCSLLKSLCIINIMTQTFVLES